MVLTLWFNYIWKYVIADHCKFHSIYDVLQYSIHGANIILMDVRLIIV